MVKKRFGQFFAIIAADNNPLFSLKVKYQLNQGSARPKLIMKVSNRSSDLFRSLGSGLAISGSLNPTTTQINSTNILVLYSLMGEKIYLEARKENLENEIHQVLNLI